MSSADPLFLGLDLSTQQLKAILLNKDSQVIHQISVRFDLDLSRHGTINGAIQGPDKGEVTSPVQMWLEAVDLLFARLHGAKVDLGAVMAVSGAGQVRTTNEIRLHPGAHVTPHSNMVQSTGLLLLSRSFLPWILTSGSLSNYFRVHSRIRRHQFGRIRRPQRTVNVWRMNLEVLGPLLIGQEAELTKGSQGIRSQE